MKSPMVLIILSALLLVGCNGPGWIKSKQFRKWPCECWETPEIVGCGNVIASLTTNPKFFQQQAGRHDVRHVAKFITVVFDRSPQAALPSMFKVQLDQFRGQFGSTGCGHRVAAVENSLTIGMRPDAFHASANASSTFASVSSSATLHTHCINFVAVT